MAKQPKSEKVPKELQAKYEEIIALTNPFCRKYLNEEYAQMCRQLTAALARKRPSPLLSGKANTWAGGIVHAVGSVNFLFDASQTPHLKASELYAHFGLSTSTGGAKSKQIRDLLKISIFDPEWTLPSRLDHNPLIWNISVNGLIVDIRQAPLPLQLEAYNKGLIPYVPAFKGEK